MEKRLSEYLTGEMRSAIAELGTSLVFLLLGIVAAIYGTGGFWNGLSHSLLFLAGLSTGNAFWTWWRTRLRSDRLPALLQQAPIDYAKSEEQRLARLQKAYSAERKLALLFFLLGFCLALLGGFDQLNRYGMGMGFGMSVLSAARLVFLLFSQWRTSLYQHKVGRFNER